MDGIGTNPSPDNIFSSYRRLLASVDSWFAGCMSSAASQIACRSGCSECCRGLFDITLLDAWYLQRGFELLPAEQRDRLREEAFRRLSRIQRLWPEFSHPYLLNLRPEEEWEELMPDDDEMPCILLDDSGCCLLYDYRPMTCRLHGLPLVDISGEVMHDEWCTMNFVADDPLKRLELRGEFDSMFKEEVLLFRLFSRALSKKDFNELDTFIPAALLIDFRGFDWERWAATAPIIYNAPPGSGS